MVSTDRKSPLWSCRTDGSLPPVRNRAPKQRPPVYRLRRCARQQGNQSASTRSAISRAQRCWLRCGRNSRQAQPHPSQFLRSVRHQPGNLRFLLTLTYQGCPQGRPGPVCERMMLISLVWLLMTTTSCAPSPFRSPAATSTSPGARANEKTPGLDGENPIALFRAICRVPVSKSAVTASTLSSFVSAVANTVTLFVVTTVSSFSLTV